MYPLPNEYIWPYYFLEEMVVSINLRRGGRLHKLAEVYDYYMSKVEDRDLFAEVMLEQVKDGCFDYLNRRGKSEKTEAIKRVQDLFNKIPLPNLCGKLEYKVVENGRDYFLPTLAVLPNNDE